VYNFNNNIKILKEKYKLAKLMKLRKKEEEK
jgi:hypothetical protein